MQRLFVFILALCGPANLIAGLAAATVASALTTVPFASSLLQWYTGHVLGGLTCTPILMMLMRGELRRWFGQTPPRGKRSEERRGGKACVSTCRSRWSTLP